MTKKTAIRKKPITKGFSTGISQHLSVERVIIGGAIVVSLMVVGIFIAIQPPGINYSQPDKSQIFPDLGRQHVGKGTPHPPYNSNPPTSGWHDPQPAAWGVYLSVIPDENVIHSMEHGGVWLSYRDVDDAETVQQLQDIARRYPSHVIMTHRPANDSRIAVAAWGHLLKMDKVDSGQIYDFIARYRMHGPENVQ